MLKTNPSNSKLREIKAVMVAFEALLNMKETCGMILKNELKKQTRINKKE